MSTLPTPNTQLPVPVGLSLQANNYLHLSQNILNDRLYVHYSIINPGRVPPRRTHWPPDGHGFGVTPADRRHFPPLLLFDSLPFYLEQVGTPQFSSKT